MSYLITGRKNPGGDSHPRLDIETLQEKHPKQFALFILSFLAIQGRPHHVHGLDPGPVKSPATFFQIGSIHGRPYEMYTGDVTSPAEHASDYNGGDRKDTRSVPSRFGGYCNHDSVLFPSWHRPCVLLIEQAIGEVATRLANQISSKAGHDFTPDEKMAWTVAAEQLRFPYWDWTDPKVSGSNYELPAVLYEETVSIELPGKPDMKRVENPISSFRFPGRDFPFDFKDEYNVTGNKANFFAKWEQTYRHATGEPSLAKSDISALTNELKKQAESVRKRLATLFQFPIQGEDSATTWDQFSNKRTQSQSTPNKDSLEGVHGSVHLIIGGSGHMGDADYAGFDPIFYLHHSNVDRLLAFWEWCYPDYWMEEGYVVTSGQGPTERTIKLPWTQPEGTYVQVYNEQVLPDSPLAPFRNGDGDYWTSSQTRFLHNEAYPKYYSYPEFMGVDVSTVPSDVETRNSARKALFEYFNGPEKKGETVYIVAVKLQKHAFNGSYVFELFDNEGDVFIGSVAVFGRSDSSPCAGCAQGRAAGATVNGVIPIPQDIVDRVEKSPNLKPDSEGIKKILSGKLFDAGGIPLGILGSGKPLQHRPEVVLLSASGNYSESLKWKNHGEIFLQDG